MLVGSEQLRPTQVIDSESSPEEMMIKLGISVIPSVLPRSSHLKNKLNGSVYPWMEPFAARSDLYENCDEQGNTSPKAWEGTKPDNMRQAPLQEPSPLKTPSGFRDIASTVIDSKASLYGQHLPDTLDGVNQKDLRESALPIPVVDAPMTELMDTLLAQLQGRWQESSDEPEKPAVEISPRPKRKRPRA